MGRKGKAKAKPKAKAQQQSQKNHKEKRQKSQKLKAFKHGNASAVDALLIKALKKRGNKASYARLASDIKWGQGTTSGLGKIKTYISARKQLYRMDRSGMVFLLGVSSNSYGKQRRAFNNKSGGKSRKGNARKNWCTYRWSVELDREILPFEVRWEHLSQEEQQAVSTLSMLEGAACTRPAAEAWWQAQLLPIPSDPLRRPALKMDTKRRPTFCSANAKLGRLWRGAAVAGFECARAAFKPLLATAVVALEAERQEDCHLFTTSDNSEDRAAVDPASGTLCYWNVWCPQHTLWGACEAGRECPFAHSDEEMSKHPAVYASPRRRIAHTLCFKARFGIIAVEALGNPQIWACNCEWKRAAVVTGVHVSASAPLVKLEVSAATPLGPGRSRVPEWRIIFIPLDLEDTKLPLLSSRLAFTSARWQWQLPSRNIFGSMQGTKHLKTSFQYKLKALLARIACIGKHSGIAMRPSATPCHVCGCTSEFDEWHDRICWCDSCYLSGCVNHAPCQVCGCTSEYDAWRDRICCCDSCFLTGCTNGRESIEYSIDTCEDPQREVDYWTQFEHSPTARTNTDVLANHARNQLAECAEHVESSDEDYDENEQEESEKREEKRSSDRDVGLLRYKYYTPFHESVAGWPEFQLMPFVALRRLILHFTWREFAVLQQTCSLFMCLEVRWCDGRWQQFRSNSCAVSQVMAEAIQSRSCIKECGGSWRTRWDRRANKRLRADLDEGSEPGQEALKQPRRTHDPVGDSASDQQNVTTVSDAVDTNDGSSMAVGSQGEQKISESFESTLTSIAFRIGHILNMTVELQEATSNAYMLWVLECTFHKVLSWNFAGVSETYRRHLVRRGLCNELIALLTCLLELPVEEAEVAVASVLDVLRTLAFVHGRQSRLGPRMRLTENSVIVLLDTLDRHVRDELVVARMLRLLAHLAYNCDESKSIINSQAGLDIIVAAMARHEEQEEVFLAGITAMNNLTFLHDQRCRQRVLGYVPPCGGSVHRLCEELFAYVQLWDPDITATMDRTSPAPVKKVKAGTEQSWWKVQISLIYARPLPEQSPCQKWPVRHAFLYANGLHGRALRAEVDNVMRAMFGRYDNQGGSLSQYEVVIFPSTKEELADLRVGIGAVVPFVRAVHHCWKFHRQQKKKDRAAEIWILWAGRGVPPLPPTEISLVASLDKPCDFSSFEQASAGNVQQCFETVRQVAVILAHLRRFAEKKVARASATAYMADELSGWQNDEISRIRDDLFKTVKDCTLCKEDILPVFEILACRDADMWLKIVEATSPSFRMLPVADVRFLHDSISARFVHGQHAGEPITQLVDDLQTGRARPNDLNMEVVWWHGKYHTLRHRRLWALKEWAATRTIQEGATTGIECCFLAKVLPLVHGCKTGEQRDVVDKLFRSYSTNNDGISVTVRGQPSLQITSTNHKPAGHTARASCSAACSPSPGRMESHASTAPLPPNRFTCTQRHDAQNTTRQVAHAAQGISHPFGFVQNRPPKAPPPVLLLRPPAPKAAPPVLLLAPATSAGSLHCGPKGVSNAPNGMQTQSSGVAPLPGYSSSPMPMARPPWPGPPPSWPAPGYTGPGRSVCPSLPSTSANISSPSGQTTADPPLSAPISVQFSAVLPHFQKQFLGERLYPKVSKYEAELVLGGNPVNLSAKITGMLLQMPNVELLKVIESETLLKTQVDRALVTLSVHSSSFFNINAILEVVPRHLHEQVISQSLPMAVSRYQPHLAPKITGVLLEIERHTLLDIMSSEEALKKYVEQASKYCVPQETTPPQG